MRFNAAAEYAPGKTLVVADTLLRSPAVSTMSSNRDVEVGCYVDYIISTLPASSQKLEGIRRATHADYEHQSVVKLVRYGWPDHVVHVNPAARECYLYKSELSE